MCSTNAKRKLAGTCVDNSRSERCAEASGRTPRRGRTGLPLQSSGCGSRHCEIGKGSSDSIQRSEATISINVSMRISWPQHPLGSIIHYYYHITSRHLCGHNARRPRRENPPHLSEDFSILAASVGRIRTGYASINLSKLVPSLDRGALSARRPR